MPVVVGMMNGSPKLSPLRYVAGHAIHFTGKPHRHANAHSRSFALPWHPWREGLLGTWL